VLPFQIGRNRILDFYFNPTINLATILEHLAGQITTPYKLLELIIIKITIRISEKWKRLQLFHHMFKDLTFLVG
jgi:hypothetical protein